MFQSKLKYHRIMLQVWRIKIFLGDLWGLLKGLMLVRGFMNLPLNISTNFKIWELFLLTFYKHIQIFKIVFVKELNKNFKNYETELLLNLSYNCGLVVNISSNWSKQLLLVKEFCTNIL